MTNLDLTSQFIRDYEELREKAERPAPPPPHDPDLLSAAAARQEEIERLEADALRLTAELEHARSRAKQLEEERAESQSQLDKVTQSERKKGEETAAKVAELELVRKTFKLKLEDLKRKHAEELEIEKERTSRAVKDAVRGIEAGFAEREKLLEDQIRKKLQSDEARISQGLKTKLREDQDTALREINRRLVKLASVPLRMRVMGLALDISILMVIASLLNRHLPAMQAMSLHHFQLAFLVAFSMRAFVSPGNILLGISAREVGTDLRETRRAGIVSRLFCGILHYGPLLATSIVASLDPKTSWVMQNLLLLAVSAFQDGMRTSSILRNLEASGSPTLPVVLLVAALLWWGLLVLSILVSPLVHRSMPYFRNTTLVESMVRVGFRRFNPPLLAAPEIK